MGEHAGDRPRVSVVLPVRDGARYLGAALDSIARQTLPDFEVVVVDDGSTDETPDIVAAFAERQPMVRVVRLTGVGLARVANAGSRAAVGDYIARMDADDIATPDRLRLQADFLDRNPEVAVVGGAVDLIDDVDRVFGHDDYPVTDADIRAALANGAPFVHPAVMIRRSAFEAVGGYRESLVISEDHDLWLRFADRYRLANLPDTVLRYRIHGGQTSAHSLDEKVFCSLAVRAAAVARRAGRPDPLDGVDHVDRETLRSIGVTDADVATETAEFCSWWARTLAGAGYRSAAEPVWAHAHAAARDAPNAGELRERLVADEARSLRRRGHRLRAAWVPLRRRSPAGIRAIAREVTARTARR